MCVLADPERIRTRAEDLVRTGADFLAASWMAAATGGKAPIDLAESAYQTLGEVQDVIRDHELPLWRIAPFGTDDPADAAAAITDLDAPADIVAAPSYRGEIAVAVDDARERAARGGVTVVVVPGAGTAARAAERLAEADLAVSVPGDTMEHPPRAGRWSLSPAAGSRTASSSPAQGWP